MNRFLKVPGKEWRRSLPKEAEVHQNLVTGSRTIGGTGLLCNSILFHCILDEDQSCERYR